MLNFEEAMNTPKEIPYLRIPMCDSTYLGIYKAATCDVRKDYANITRSVIHANVWRS